MSARLLYRKCTFLAAKCSVISCVILPSFNLPSDTVCGLQRSAPKHCSGLGIMSRYVFSFSHNASILKRKVLASYSYRSGLIEIVVASYSNGSGLLGIVTAYNSSKGYK